MAGDEESTNDFANAGASAGLEEDTGAYEDNATRQVSADALKQIRESTENEAVPEWLAKVRERKEKGGDAPASNEPQMGGQASRPKNLLGDLNDSDDDTAELENVATKAINRNSLSEALADYDERTKKVDAGQAVPKAGILRGRKQSNSNKAVAAEDLEEAEAPEANEVVEAPKAPEAPQAPEEPEAFEEPEAVEPPEPEEPEAVEPPEPEEPEAVEEFDVSEELETPETLDTPAEIAPVSAEESSTEEGASGGLAPTALFVLAPLLFVGAGIAWTQADAPSLTDPIIIGPVAAGAVALVVALMLRR
ncbi:hypothetical protein FIV42_16750 [Persicimonas caeni]|uniref:Uncharacterized protein n=1 Tax=Persicimonas caeni TaxID=2292766 RepID=A0A4Y6PWE4_PERCE|nr:hypothetical protein [Persicimonas caeni]QDG52327.1 hypothetical protein FIV42_16750 [Persicimonas caeni]QED33549.1 hypothetical protein FRD00_16745 [Persicimonas caeni]